MAALAASFALSATAFAGEPSGDCRTGALLCKDAFDKLEKCEQAAAGDAKACTAERADTDSACKSTASACDKDGSRGSPR